MERQSFHANSCSLVWAETSWSRGKLQKSKPLLERGCERCYPIGRTLSARPGLRTKLSLQCFFNELRKSAVQVVVKKNKIHFGENFGQTRFPIAGKPTSILAKQLVFSRKKISYISASIKDNDGVLLSKKGQVVRRSGGSDTNNWPPWNCNAKYFVKWRHDIQ